MTWSLGNNVESAAVNLKTGILEMSKFYRISQFSDLTSVTIRTLHYYDEIGLLKPSHRTLNHHRVYTNEDILPLQQITTFKFMGFSLDQIKEIVLKSSFNPTESLKTQAKIITEEAERIQTQQNCCSI